MAHTFTLTETYSNVTRLELEQLRRADFFAGGKALTVGDAANYLSPTVGKGDVNAEPYATSLVLPLDQIFTNTPPSRPGQGISTLTQVANGGVTSETVQWFGPSLQWDSASGFAFDSRYWTDNTSGLNFASFVQVGDLLLVKSGATAHANDWTVATVESVETNSLICTEIRTSAGGTAFTRSSVLYTYAIVRPTAVQLFSVPGSGPTGREQSFLTVLPGSSLHTKVAPTHAEIMADRITNLVTPDYAIADGGKVAADRADSVFASPAPRTSLDYLGYRVVLYPANSSGDPDLANPIATLNPIIDSTVPANDQRMTLDYSAGIIRFSCAPRAGDQINPASYTDPTTGRLNLYAVYWAYDETLLRGRARGLWTTRSTDAAVWAPGKVEFDLATNTWKLHSTPGINKFFVHAPSAVENLGNLQVDFGTVDSRAGLTRSFIYHDRQDTWKFIRNDSGNELEVADKTSLTIGDGASPAIGPGGDAYPITPWSTATGYKNVSSPLDALLKAAAVNGFGTVHLRKGRYYVNETIQMPPGVVLEGEGPGTRIELVSTTDQAVVRFGPNTPWGVYDFDYSEFGMSLPHIDLSSLGQVEGYDICWNATRRVWGVSWADLSTQSVWFNEIRTDGTWVYPGLGYQLKTSAYPLFSSASLLSEHYTPGHYPRMDYDPFRDMYVVVWCEKGATGVGTLYLRCFQVSSSGLIDLAPSSSIGEGYYNPSIICASDGSPTQCIFVVAASRPYVNGAEHGDKLRVWTMDLLGDLFRHVDVPIVSDYSSRHPVISSTDVTYTEQGALVAMSVRAHPFVSGLDGTISGQTFTAPSVDFTTTCGSGCAGSRLHFLGSVTASETYPEYAGLDGRVLISTGTHTLQVLRNDSPNNSWDAVTPIKWAVTPTSNIVTALVTTGYAVYTVVDSAYVADRMTREMREPDFVRIHKGSGTSLVTFQAFNSTAYLAHEHLKDFEGVNQDCRSQYVYREHLGTCAVVVGSGGCLISPASPDSPYNPTEDVATDQLYSWNSDVSVKNLGAPHPLVMRPNSLWLNMLGATPLQSYGPSRGYHLDISARHLVHRWSGPQPSSLIPDLTWTGQDWVVVSPTQARLYSDTGWSKMVGLLQCIVDPTIYFGAAGTTWELYVPAIAGTLTGTVISEHVLNIPLGVLTLDTQYEYYVVNSSSGLDQLYNLTYRVAADGSLISSSTNMPGGLTDPMTAVSSKPELLSRRELGTEGANSPAAYGTQYPNFSGYNSAGWDMYYPTSRITGDIGFTGICAGAPKKSNYRILAESPVVSIAWGENLYAFLDRNVTPSINQILCYRQNSGPFRSGLENLSVVGKTFTHTFWSTSTKVPLQIKSRRHIYTRWGAPSTGTIGFATDGYRICFVHPSEVASPVTDYFVYSSYHAPNAGRTSWNATYTDATGNGGIELQGPSSTYRMSAGLFGFPINDNILDATDQYHPRVSYLNPSAAKVVWNGKNFVAFWIEENKADNGGLVYQPAQGGLICMGVFPGNEGTHTPDALMTPQQQGDIISPQVAQVARISSGLGASSTLSGIGPCNQVLLGQVYVCDVAYSGSAYAVLWVAGLAIGTENTVDLERKAGNALGITIFRDASMQTGALSYLIEIEGVPNIVGYPPINGLELIANTTPKVVWTGNEFLLSWSTRHTTPASFDGLRYTTMGENGPAEPIQIRRAAGYHQHQSNVSYLGVMRNDATPTVFAHIDMAYPVHAGDIILITGFEPMILPPVPPQIAYSGLGAYVVRYYVHGEGTVVGRAYLNLTAALPTDLHNRELYGMVLSAGVGDRLNLPVGSAPDEIHQPASCSAMNVNTATTSQLNNYYNNASLGNRILDIAYNSDRNELAVLYADSETNENLYITVISRTNLTSTTTKKLLDSSEGVGTGSLSWNGIHYLVVYTCRPQYGILSPTVDGLFSVLLSADLGVVSQTQLQQKTNYGYPEQAPIGNLEGQVPGPLYGPLVTDSDQYWSDPSLQCCLQPRCRKIQVSWNSIAGTWLVGASYLWAVDQASTIGSIPSPKQNPHFVRLNDYTVSIPHLSGYNPITGYTGTTLTGKFFVPLIQPGMRLMLWNTDKVVVVFTVLSVGAVAGPDGIEPYNLARYYTSLEVDVSRDTLVTPAVVTDAATSVLVPAREDVFLWTLSEGSAAVQVQDADSCWLSNVDISGSAVDVSEVYNWASRPTWRSVGAMTGYISAMSTSRDNVQMERHYTRSFLTPKDKIETVRLTNVRSRTGAKYGKKA